MASAEVYDTLQLTDRSRVAEVFDATYAYTSDAIHNLSMQAEQGDQLWRAQRVSFNGTWGTPSYRERQGRSHRYEKAEIHVPNPYESYTRNGITLLYRTVKLAIREFEEIGSTPLEVGAWGADIKAWSLDPENDVQARLHTSSGQTVRLQLESRSRLKQLDSDTREKFLLISGRILQSITLANHIKDSKNPAQTLSPLR